MCARSGEKTALALNPAPAPQPRACISSGRASKNCLAQRSTGRCGCDHGDWRAVNSLLRAQK